MLFKGFLFEYYYYRFYHGTRDHGEYRGFQGASIIAVTLGLSAADILLAIESYFNYYPFKNVTGFGAVIAILGLAQCDTRRKSLVYILLFLLLQVYDLGLYKAINKFW